MDLHRAQAFALEVAPLAAAVANYCDHAEHNEALERRWVLEAGAALRSVSARLCAEEGLSLVELYADRLGVIEQRNVVRDPESWDGRLAARQACTWRDLQLVQIAHDRVYHQDVAGLAKFEQLRHYALHVSKIVGAFAVGRDPEDLLRRRLADSVIFGLKLSTVMGERLSETPLPSPVQPGSLVSHPS